MKCSEVSKDDVRLAAQVVNMLKSGEWSLPGSQLFAAVDAMRWFQSAALAVSHGYAAEQPPEGMARVVDQMPPPASPSGPLGPGVSIKDYNPGNFAGPAKKSKK